MAVKPLLHGVALLALVAAASACGSGHSNATRLTIEVRDDLGVHAWRLECNPPSGTAPSPRAICGKLRRSPQLLVGGPRIGGGLCSAPPAFTIRGADPSTGPVFHVSGRYRGYPVDASFAQGCEVLGQKDAYSTWWSLMNGAAGSGVAEKEFTAAVTTHGDQKQEARAQRLRSELRALLARRKARLAAGTFKAFALDPLDVRIIRDRLELMSLSHGPLLASAKVYADAPVYEVAVRFAYRDYTGRRHPGGIGYTSVGEEFFGKSIPPIQSFGPFPGDEQGPNFGQLGRPVTLTFPDR